ncbi:MAG: hypothetical protein IPM91_15780 [Bacteroidetes bacterium]|nr:hypothetical protein [Bacteroidota bacterium]
MLGAVTMSAQFLKPFLPESNATVTIGPAAQIACPLNVEAGGVCMNGGTFGGKVSLLKTGAGNNTGNGNNVFSDSLSIVNNGTGYMVFSNSVRDIYNGVLSATTNSSGIVYLAHRGTNTEFNENIIVSSTSNGSIRFGASTGTSSLATGKTFIVGTSGFNSGSLNLSRFTQTGANPLSFTLGSGAILILGPALVLNGDVSINSEVYVLMERHLMEQFLLLKPEQQTMRVVGIMFIMLLLLLLIPEPAISCLRILPEMYLMMMLNLPVQDRD